MPRVSIIVPAFNAGPYIGALCDSIQAQTFTDFEALFLDDASNDNTRDVLDRYSSDGRFRIVRWRENRGVNAATSALLTAARGEYWCHPGADDVLLPDFLSRRVALMDASPNAAIIHGPGQNIGPDGCPVVDNSPLPQPPALLREERALSVLLQHNIINTPSVLVRMGVTRLVEPWFLTRWTYAQDWYLWLLHLATGFDLLWDSEQLHQYRVHLNSLTNDPARETVRRAEVRLVPLCALSVASRWSPQARRCWNRWGRSLYALWLRRALALHRTGHLKDEWLEMGASAFCGIPRSASLPVELLKHGLAIFRSTQTEKSIRAQQSFPVSGLSEVDDPMFRTAISPRRA